MTDKQIAGFFERVIEAGDQGLAGDSLSPEEFDFAHEQVNATRVFLRLDSGKEFFVERYGAHEWLYGYRGWVRRVQGGMLLTPEGMRWLKFVPLDGDE